MDGSQRAIPAGSVIWPSQSRLDFNLECHHGEGGVGDVGDFYSDYSYSIAEKKCSTGQGSHLPSATVPPLATCHVLHRLPFAPSSNAGTKPFQLHSFTNHSHLPLSRLL